ncbi:MAG: phosphopantetheine-binding protein [Thermoplasmata archaeon]
MEIIIERISVLSDIKVSDIKIDSLFEDDLKFDNLDLAELFMDLEDKLKITMDYNMFYEIKTVGDLISYIKSLI